jgi:hypothetical protein
MFCTYCQKNRPENEAPCPNCGAASPLQGQMPIENWGTPEANSGSWNNAGAGSFSWRGQAPAAQEVQWGEVSQVAFGAPNVSGMVNNNGWASFAPSPPDEPWQSPPGASYAAPEAPPHWSQVSQVPFPQQEVQSRQQSPVAPSIWGGQEQQGSEDAAQSMLPVPYQGQNGLQLAQAQAANLPVLVQPPTTLAELAPSLPESSVYVPPTFTKPRPLIPRYRIVSGMLSLLIVALAVCGGLAYFAKTNSTINTLARTFTGAPPSQPVSSTGANLPNPKVDPDHGPAFNMIPVAATASRIDLQTNTPLQPTQSFTTNQTIYLTFTVPNPQNGTITTKWYMNNEFYQAGPPISTQQSDQARNGRVQETYAVPSEGFVEIYWNGQLAQRLFFVVRQ